MNPYWAEIKTDDGMEGAVNKAVNFSDKLWDWFANVDMWTSVLFSGIRIIVLFLVTRIIIRVVSKLIDRSLARQEQSRMNMNPRRFATVAELMKNVTSVTCNFVMVLLILSEFNFHLGPLLAGAGVLGLAIGFGAQSLVKDVITGFFIILEDQFAVGDVIQTGTYKGTVELIGLRSTRIVNMNGETYILPNGMITSVTNYSFSNALAMVDMPVKNERKLEDTVSLIKSALTGMQERDGNIIAVPDVLGIQSMNTSEYVIRIVAQCVPNTRTEVERMILENIKQAMEFEDMQKQALAELAASDEKGGE
ncbi:mechanosensitive ion channel family protein [Paenibacillus dokdonensis]|uniref:Mechanosensitive ion channel family protein n=1 Tax=Paenibacillus dokdonensis TaxID=2567944 RepID=A0ABU6GVW2_9BACL|nr:mechanosensitive ion channel family protein [Paenibacillus dokdonensis]MEC0243872.1 mechanosensitive ion channel family protein [Paenibacillus dokdonensis]